MLLVSTDESLSHAKNNQKQKKYDETIDVYD